MYDKDKNSIETQALAKYIENNQKFFEKGLGETFFQKSFSQLLKNFHKYVTFPAPIACIRVKGL